MGAMADSFSAMVRYETSERRPLLSTSSSEGKDHDANSPQRQLATATAAQHEERTLHDAGKPKACAGDDQLHHILDTTKHKHYRRRRSSVSIKLSKPASILELQQQQAEATLQQLIAWEAEGQNPQTQSCAVTDHAHFTPNCCHESDEHEARAALEQVKNQEHLNACPAADQHSAIVIHKPQPLPLRSSSLSPSPFSGSSYSIKLLFDRENEVLLQWQKKDFQTFTKEVQESLGGTLRKHIEDYARALEFLRQPINVLAGPVNGDSVITAGAAASPSSSSPKEDGHVEGYLKARQHSWNAVNPGNGLWQLIDAAGSSTLQIDGDISVPVRPSQERNCHGKMESDSAGANTWECIRFHGSTELLREMLDDRMDKVIKAFANAREAVVSIREVSQRIEEHRTWMQLELNLTRLELMNLRFCRCNNPRAVLREAMGLAGTVRSFILELSSALDCNDLGVPWPLPRKADCSDVTPLFIKQLVTTLSASTA